MKFHHHEDKIKYVRKFKHKKDCDCGIVNPITECVSNQYVRVPKRQSKNIFARECGGDLMDDKVTITISLTGKNECGNDDRPESCLDCSELPNCVLDTFYDAVNKMENSK